MKKIKFFAFCLAVLMILPFVASCNDKGTPYTFKNVKVISYVEQLEEGEESDPEFDGLVLFEEPVDVYSKTGEITIKDLIFAIDENAEFNESGNRFTSIKGIAAADGNMWLYLLNKEDSRLSATIKPEDEILIYFGDLPTEEAPAA